MKIWTASALVGALAVAIPGRAAAAQLEAPLAAITGAYTELGETRVANFDLGSHFESIERVHLRLDWRDIVEGFCAGFTCYEGTGVNIAIRDQRLPQDPLPSFESINAILPYGGVQEVDGFLLFALAPVRLEPVEDGYVIVVEPSPLEVIGDGTGSVAVQLTSARGTLASADIVVSGTLVPEPAGLAWPALATLAGIRARTRRGTRARGSARAIRFATGSSA